MTKHNTNLPIKTWRRWHRRIGVGAALFIIWLVISGMLLNHSVDLGLDKWQLRSEALAGWYGIAEPLPEQIFTADHHWLAGNSQHWLLDGKLISPSHHRTVGMVATANMLVVASSKSLRLLTPNGELIDQLSGQDLPVSTIQKLGRGCDGFILQGTGSPLASTDGLSWTPCTHPQQWSQPRPISSSQLSTAKALLIPPISAEKLLLDLHSGLFFGSMGKVIVDAIGLCLLILALSGVWMFYRQNKRK